MQAIVVNELTKQYNDHNAVDKVSFSVPIGQIFGLLGPNGAGKTTAIKMLTTLLHPSSGNAKVWGFDVDADREKVRHSIGIVFQEPALDNRLTGYENLDFHARLYGIDKLTRKKRISEVLDIVELGDRADNLVKTYSGGMQRRLEIARGLIHHPKVLFLDEPTLGLDAQTRRKIWDYIKNLNISEKTTIVLTTHYMEEADYLCERVAILDQGKIIASDTPKNLKNSLGGDVITIGVNPLEKAKLAFSKLDWVKDISEFNDKILLNVDDGEKKIPLLVKCDQEDIGIKIESINLRKPTLEDVFIKFTGKSIRQESVDETKENAKRLVRRRMNR